MTLLAKKTVFFYLLIYLTAEKLNYLAFSENSFAYF